MHITITGATGFVGMALVRRLVASGHELVVLVRAPTQALDRVRQIIVPDLEVFDGWARVVKDAGAVIHLAGLAHQAADRLRLERINVRVTLDAARAAADAGARFVYVSSVKVHGEETSAQPLRETSPIAPRDDYGRSKAAAETAFHDIHNLRATVLRPPLVYGPGVKANFFALMRAIARGWPLPFASIENRRSLIYVGNLCDAIIRCLEAPQAAGRTYLVTNGAPVSTPQLCRALGDALGRPARLFPFPAFVLELHPGLRRLTRSLEVDDSAIRRELGWQPPYTFEEGLRLTAEWYRVRGG